MNLTNTLRNWCLALVSIALLAVSGAGNAAPNGRKQFYSTLPDAPFIPAGNPVLINVYVDNTSTEPATINTIAVCNAGGIEFLAGPLDDGGPTGNAVPAGAYCPSGGVLIKDISGLRRGGKATFVLTAKVTGTCTGATSGTVQMSASTGNTTSFTADFYATDKDGNLLASGVLYTSTPVAPGCEGDVQCGQQVPLANTNNGNPFDPWEPGQAQSIRQLFNSDGQACALVPYDFTNILFTNSEAILKWPTNGTQKAAVFRNHVTGQLKNQVTDYPLPTRSKFSWLLDSTTGLPVSGSIADALMCLDSEYPRPYATLNNPLPATTGNDYSFTVSWSSPGPIVPGLDAIPSTPAIDPYADPSGWKLLPNTNTTFEFNVDGERIRATVVSTSGTPASGSAVLKIATQNDRGLGYTGPSGTAGAAFGQGSSHDTGDFVLSLVMPVMPIVSGSPYSGQVARACVISHGIRMYSPNPGTQGSQYFEFLEYFDGDAWTRVGQ